MEQEKQHLKIIIIDIIKTGSRVFSRVNELLDSLEDDLLRYELWSFYHENTSVKKIKYKNNNDVRYKKTIKIGS